MNFFCLVVLGWYIGPMGTNIPCVPSHDSMPGTRNGRFHLKCRNLLRRVRGVREAGRTSEPYLGSRNLPTHSYTYIRDQSKLWWDSDAPDPSYDETVHPLEKSPTCRSTPLTGAKRGRHMNFFLFSMLRPYIDA